MWLENRYPGVACDVPAPCFTFLFEDNPDWSSYYASGKEINDYIASIADKYQTRQYVKFNHTVKQAKWDEDKGTWNMLIHDDTNNQVGLSMRRHCDGPLETLFNDYVLGQMIEDEADILLLGWGQLNNWEFPNVPGLHDFKGPYMHSADYDETFDPTGKIVAVVGGGSTGVQVLPEVQKVAKQVHQYMRSK